MDKLPDSAQSPDKVPSKQINFERLIESMRDVIWLLDVETMRFTYVSPSVLTLRGYTPQEVMAQHLDAALTPEGEEHIRALVKERVQNFLVGKLARNHQFIEELEQRCKDGSTVWTEVLSHYQLNTETGRIEVCGVARDITQRRNTIKALRISEIRHRLLADHANDVIWTMGMDGSITYVSPAVERVRGFTQQEAMRQTLDQILTPDSQASSLRYFGEMLQAIGKGRTPKAYRGEQEYYCKDGSTFWTEVMAFPVQSDDGSVIELLGITRDIDTRKRYAEEIRQAHAETEHANQALLEANKELSRLAEIERQQAEEERVLREEQEKLFAMLAHELKTPLATVKMVASGIRRDDGHEIARAVREMNDVIERCVHSGQLSDKRLVPRIEELDLSVLLAESVALSRWNGRIVYTENNGNILIQTDTQMLRMIIENLIDNASKYSQENSLVEVDLTFERRGEVDGYVVRVLNLPGDAGWPDTDKLFDKYYRSPHAQRQTGAGLGLFLISGLAQLLGGRLDYKPTLTHICFACWLPALPLPIDEAS